MKRRERQGGRGVSRVLAAPFGINVHNSSDASREERFLATIKDEAVQKYTGTNVSFKVRAAATFSPLAFADTAGPPLLSQPSSFPLLPSCPLPAPPPGSALRAPWFRANRVSRRAYVISVDVARSKVRKKVRRSSVTRQTFRPRCYPRGVWEGEALTYCPRDRTRSRDATPTC